MTTADHDERSSDPRSASGYFAIKLDAIETRKLRAERWPADGESPKWAAHNRLFEFGLAALPNSCVGVVVEATARDDEARRAVSAQFIARYYVADLTKDPTPPDSGNIEDTAAFIGSLSSEDASDIVNTGVTDITPFIRETFQDISMRLRPGHRPIFVGSLPSITFKTEDGKVTATVHPVSTDPL
ncbi:hypothetical protein [Nocardia aurantia]|uniref:Uncharacterized protein n=1 Tax=Nocardia aurantia TaxID=2585199 RepID=A0A7K0DH46_9NOCA|nr:hypothetical protein [Nocardia aurantia]MQY25133.1 hypothetical protein [Nocardia aurantia]